MLKSFGYQTISLFFIKMDPAIITSVLVTESLGLACNAITLFYILSSFDVKTHVFTLILLGKGSFINDVKILGGMGSRIL